MVSFKRPSLERKRKSPLFPWGFLACADGQGRGGTWVFFWFFCLVSPGQGGDSSCTTWTPEFAPPPYGPGPGHLKAFKTPQGGDSPQPSTRRLALCSRDCFLLDPPPPARPPPQASQRDSASWVVVAPSTVAMTGDVETDRCALGP